MSPELVAIITAAIALAGLILITTGRLGARITTVEGRLGARISTVEGRLGARLTAVEKETARLSGLLEGLGPSSRLPPKPGAGGGGEADT